MRASASTSAGAGAIGAAGEPGVCLAGLVEWETSGDPRAEPSGGYLIKDDKGRLLAHGTTTCLIFEY